MKSESRTVPSRIGAAGLRLLLVMTATLVGGCGGMGPGGHLRYGDDKLAEGKCSSAVYEYATVILAAKNDKNMQSRPVDEAIERLRSVAPSCSSDTRYVAESVQSAASYLSETRPQDALQMLDLLFTLADQYPQTYLELSPFDVFKFLNDQGDEARWKRAYALLINQGIWKASDVDTMLTYGMGRQKDDLKVQQALTTLRGQLDKAAAYASQATGGRCKETYSLRYCGNTTLSSDAVAYQRAFAVGLESAGLAGTRRVAVMQTLADTTAMELARYEGRLQAIAAQTEADPASSNAMVGAVTALAGAAVQARAPAPSTGRAAISSLPTAIAMTAQPPVPTRVTSPSAGAATRPAAGAGSPDAPQGPFRYSPSVNECVRIQSRPNTVATETITNTCGYAISIIFCREGTVAAGDFKGRQIRDCSGRLTGGAELGAGQSDSWNYMTRGVSTQFVACRKPFYLPSTKIQWRPGGEFSGQCQVDRAAAG